jgi:hypothetical protein
MDEKKNLALTTGSGLPIKRLQHNNIILTSRQVQVDVLDLEEDAFKECFVEEVYDLLAVRINLRAGPEKSGGRIAGRYTHLSQISTSQADRLRDWISRPKPNGMRRLPYRHGSRGRWLRFIYAVREWMTLREGVCRALEIQGEHHSQRVSLTVLQPYRRCLPTHVCP